MSAKCSKCGMRIFDEKGQSWGTQLPGGDWICHDDCELGLSLQPDVIPPANTISLTEEELQGMTVQLPPPSLSILTINENFQVHFTDPMPGRWHRFWYRVLLGWKWEKV